jgi:hypothetical protein
MRNTRNAAVQRVPATMSDAKYPLGARSGTIARAKAAALTATNAPTIGFDTVSRRPVCPSDTRAAEGGRADRAHGQRVHRERCRDSVVETRPSAVGPTKKRTKRSPRWTAVLLGLNACGGDAHRHKAFSVFSSRTPIDGLLSSQARP